MPSYTRDAARDRRLALASRPLSTPISLQLEAACSMIAMFAHERLMIIKVPGPIPVKTAF